MLFYLKKIPISYDGGKKQILHSVQFYLPDNILHSVKTVSRGANLRALGMKAGSRATLAAWASAGQRAGAAGAALHPRAAAVTQVPAVAQPLPGSRGLFSTFSPASRPLASGRAAVGHSLRYFKACVFCWRGQEAFAKGTNRFRSA